MIHAGLLAAFLATAQPATPAAPLKEAAHAIDAGRLDQARIMISNAVALGARGPAVDHLLADLAYARGAYDEALGRYEALAVSASGGVRVIERAGLAALKSGQRGRARTWIAKAITDPAASWQAWNALGVLADGERDFAAADEAYQRARQLAPDEAEILNNIGWSHSMRGEWELALDYLGRAKALAPKSMRIANNLELARAAVAEDLPRRLSGEDDEAWAARLNDAGVVAQRRGDKARAVAAFTRAIEARSTWFERAANNLEIAQAK